CTMPETCGRTSEISKAVVRPGNSSCSGTVADCNTTKPASGDVPPAALLDRSASWCEEQAASKAEAIAMRPNLVVEARGGLRMLASVAVAIHGQPPAAQVRPSGPALCAACSCGAIGSVERELHGERDGLVMMSGQVLLEPARKTRGFHAQAHAGS